VDENPIFDSQPSHSEPEVGQHLAFGKVFKPVGWAKPSLARSASTSKGGQTGENERGLPWQTPYARLEC
jgi:hypothetical protein